MSNYIPSLEIRLTLGLAIFLSLGLYDYFKNPNDPKRAKEYLFIVVCSFSAIIFAIIHDGITFNISREYFVIAKDLGKKINFFPDIILLSAKASYWVGILIGVILLIGNNPYKDYPRQDYNYLAKLLIHPLCMAVIGGITASILSFILPPYFSLGGESLLKDIKSFETVACIHWGTYIGGLLGCILALHKLIQSRKRIKNE